MFLRNLFGNDTITLVIFLAIFLIIGYKALEVLRNVLIIALLAAAFPYALNYLGFSFQTSLNSELQYIVAGIGLYLLYELAKMALGAGGIVWALAKIAAKPIAWIYDGLRDLVVSIFGKRKRGAPEETKANDHGEEPEKMPPKKKRNGKNYYASK